MQQLTKLWMAMIIFWFITLKIMGQDNTIVTLKEESLQNAKKAADTSSQWNRKKGGAMNLQMSQGSLSNWAAGGDNFSFSANSSLNYYFFFKKNRLEWNNNIDFNLGYIQSTSLGGRKNDDRFDFLSKYNLKLSKKKNWFLSTLFNFRTQLFDGYNSNNNIEVFTSSFLSPAYQLLSIGIDYKPHQKLSFFLSPITSRMIIVANKKLAAKASYGVDTGQTIKSEMGGFATINFNYNLDKNIDYRGRLDLFSNYLDHPENVDVFMTNRITFKINKFLSATYSLDLIYDDNVRIFGDDGKSPALQAKSLLGIGYSKILSEKKVVLKQL